MNRLMKTGPMARELGVTVAWLKAESDAGRIPHIKAGKRYLFEPEAVKKVLIDRARQGGER